MLLDRCMQVVLCAGVSVQTEYGRQGFQIKCMLQHLCCSPRLVQHQHQSTPHPPAVGARPLQQLPRTAALPRGRGAGAAPQLARHNKRRSAGPHIIVCAKDQTATMKPQDSQTAVPVPACARAERPGFSPHREAAPGTHRGAKVLAESRHGMRTPRSGQTNPNQLPCAPLGRELRRLPDARTPRRPTLARP